MTEGEPNAAGDGNGLRNHADDGWWWIESSPWWASDDERGSRTYDEWSGWSSWSTQQPYNWHGIASGGIP